MIDNIIRDHIKPRKLYAQLKEREISLSNDFHFRMIGTMQVNKPSGMEVLNNSIDTLVNQIPKDEWKMVSVAVAPSTITVSFVDGGEPPLDCRVRFLSFLGIGQQNAQYCAFIVHTSQVNVLMVCG